ncbi:hypothetical protein [Orrella marina]|uniref:Uncharacterized protein n=1 Tax=Orrella marina TaxID=2163011 RepID=A0A2R4XGY4_9BURK|nr:hypothetical protein [Orrella marina]AWB33070.1 hypothetical protein DBV39_04320 [Orrella marina]
MAKRLPAVHHRFGIKPEPLTAKAICDGVVAGMLGDHFLGRSEAAFESAIRPYVLAVAHKRGFGAFLEFPLEKQTSGRGAHKKIDAVLVYGKQASAFELKTIRKNAVGFNLQEDLAKLRRFPDEVAQEGNQRRATSWQLVAWTSQTFSRTKSAQQERDKGLALLKKEIEKGDAYAQLTVSDAYIDNVPRSATLGQLLLSQGNVGNFHVWCAAICIDAPSC